MSDVVTVRRNERGSWCVYVRGNFISDHATHAAARAAAQNVARAEETVEEANARLGRQVWDSNGDLW